MEWLKWWLRPENPRISYLLAGGMFVTAADFVMLAFNGSLWWSFTGGIIAYAACALVGWQRDREVRQARQCEIENDADFELAANEIMQAIANRINDDLESKGHGRPVHVDRLSIH